MRLQLGQAFVYGMVLLGAVGACSKTNNVDQSKETTNNLYSKQIGKKGGPLGDVKTLGAFIPALAVDEEQEFTIRTAADDEYPALPAGAVGDVYSFEPHDLLFNTAVDVYLPSPSGTAAGFIGLHAPIGGDWEEISPESPLAGAKSVRLKTLSFSYFALREVGQGVIPNASGGAAGAAGAAAGGASTSGTGGMPVGGNASTGGTPGTGGTTGAGAVSGNGGVPGAGGESSSCMADPTADSGNCTSSGEVNVAGKLEPFDALDGFAVLDEQADPPELTVVFSDYPGACGVALGMNGSVRRQEMMPSGQANGRLVTAKLMLDTANGPATPGVDSYPRSGEGDKLEAFHVEVGGQCETKPSPLPGPSNLVITDMTPTRVIGTLTVTQQPPGVDFTADFDVPICPLAPIPMPTCCIQ